MYKFGKNQMSGTMFFRRSKILPYLLYRGRRRNTGSTKAYLASTPISDGKFDRMIMKVDMLAVDRSIVRYKS